MNVSMESNTAERLEAEIRVDLCEEHLAAGIVAADWSCFWLTKSLSHRPARMYMAIFKLIEKVFDEFENSYALSGSYRVI